MILIVSKKRLAEAFRLWAMESNKDKRTPKERIKDFIAPDYGEKCAYELLRRLKRGGK
jgi:hypothetical protein